MARARERRGSVRLAGALLFVLIAAQFGASGSTWVAGLRVPKNYKVVRSEQLAAGVWHVELRRSRPGQTVHIARLERSSPHRLKMVLSNGLVAGPEPRTEKTSRMCARVDCLLAVNGDYFSDGMPVGGLLIDGEPVRSPSDLRKQFTLAADETPDIGSMTMSGSLVTVHQRISTGFRLLSQTTFENRSTTIHGVNVPRPKDGIVLFTPRWGAGTGTEGGYELVGRVVSPAGRLRSGVATTIELIGGRSKGGKIPSDGVVLSGRGDGAASLAAIWKEASAGSADRSATLRVDAAPAALQSVAGKEVLVQNGNVVATEHSSRAPRTMIGWNAAGDVLLVTVDGRRPSKGATGFTIIEAADFMRRLGAVEALNLDGGGSTTFVRKGKVANRPSSSGRRERSVAVAVAIVP